MKLLIVATTLMLCTACAEVPGKAEVPYSNHRIIERDLSGQMAAEYKEKS